VVDGDSQDRTADIVRDYAKKNGIVRLQEMPQNRGKGCGVRNGVMNAPGRIILSRMLICRHP
jgi:glycosyltransferase involved in cell wall biosynthesis